MCLASPNLAPITTVERKQDVGSDHFPIKVIINLTPAVQHIRIQKRWVLQGVKWNAFQRDLSHSSKVMPDSVENLNEDITRRIIKAANNNVKETSGIFNPSKRSPWWNADISRKVAERRRAKRKLELHPTNRNLQEYKIKSNNARNAINEAKKLAWQNYVNDIKSDTPIKEVWSKIRSLQNKQIITSVPIIHNGDILTSSQEKVNCLAKYFKENNNIMMLHREQEYKEIIDKQITQHDENDREITMMELNQSIKNLKITSPGLDKVSSKFLQELSTKAKEELLYMYNISYGTASIPQQWKIGIVAPILKPGKDEAEVASYRPITLLSCLGKLLERIINTRIIWVIETKNLLHNSQCGFRQNMSTMDVIVRVNEVIKKAIIHGEYCIVIYLDLKSAFDKVSHTAILYKMVQSGFKGKILRWIKEYLSGRHSKVKLFGEYSDAYNNISGVPQGAVLSPTLFNIVMSDLPKIEDINIYSYADDITISTSGTHLQETKKKMQKFLDELALWFDVWNIKLNEGKTVMQTFTRRRNFNAPVLRWKNRIIEMVNCHKLLGMYLDSPKLTWHAHIEHLYSDCNRRLNILKSLSSTTWGASRKMLRIFYISYIRSKIEYGCEIYSVASAVEFDKLNKIQNAALRVIIGARKTTPILSLEVDSFVPPLRLWCNYKSSKYHAKLMHRPLDDTTCEILGLKNYAENNVAYSPALIFRSRIEYILKNYHIENMSRRYNNRVNILSPYCDIEQILIDAGITNNATLEKRY